MPGLVTSSKTDESRLVLAKFHSQIVVTLSNFFVIKVIFGP
jgi:hypothetical protein